MLETQADYAACVALQRDTWGRDFGDVVPGSILLISQRMGGVAAGAFDGAGGLVGFVFGMTGIERGEIVHWSDMLAVRPAARNKGVGRRLKEFQRQAVARVGGRVIYWTADPLVARNAHINFNVLGVRAVQYVRDMYGNETGSVLHRGIGTDRLIVAWPVDEALIAARRRETQAARDAGEFHNAPVVADIGNPDRRADADIGHVPRIRIAVPLDVASLLATDMARASEWRVSTRLAFETALASEYHVEGFYADRKRERGYYLLARN